MVLKLIPQVGVAGFFIDIGVVHPEKQVNLYLVLNVMVQLIIQLNL